MKGVKSLICGLNKKKPKSKRNKLLSSRQLSNYSSLLLSGYTLETACTRGDLASVMEILDSLPYSNTKPRLGQALSNAAQCGHQDVVNVLLEANADPNEVDQKGMTALMHASHRGHTRVVEILLAREETLLDYQDPMSEGTALHYACRSGHKDVISRLLDAGADPNAHFPGAESPLTLCAQHPQDLFPVIQTLVQNGADVNYVPDHAMPALHRVALRRCPETTIFLLQNGANLQHWVSFTGPVLHRIAADKLSKNQCFCHTRQTITALLDYDSVDVNCPTSGTTPLMCAVRRGNVDCINTLLKLNADPDVKNKQSHTAVQIALSNDIPFKTKIVNMLMSAECSLAGAPVVATTYDIFTHDDGVYSTVKEAKTNPRLLKRLCRRFIRRHLGSHLEAKVRALSLSKDLHDFLLLDDVPDVDCICKHGKARTDSKTIEEVISQTRPEYLRISTNLIEAHRTNNIRKIESVESELNKKKNGASNKPQKHPLKSYESDISAGPGDPRDSIKITPPASMSQLSKQRMEDKTLIMERSSKKAKTHWKHDSSHVLVHPERNGRPTVDSNVSPRIQEVAAEARPRVASAGMVDLLKVKNAREKAVTLSKSTSTHSIKKSVSFNLQPDIYQPNSSRIRIRSN